MSTPVERLDWFVRWFFNSSPEFDLIQPPDSSEVATEAPARPARHAPSVAKPPPQAHLRTRLNRIHA